MIRIAIALVALVLLLPAPAEARECARWGICYIEKTWPEYSYRKKCCLRWTDDYGPRVYGYARRDYDDGGHCRDVRRAVGDQHLTVEGAKKAANDSWAATVRFHIGEKHMDLNNARHIAYTCSRSSIKEGGVTTLGQTLTICEIEAKPCAPRREKEDRDDR